MKRAKRIFSYVQDGRTAYRIDMHVEGLDGTRTRYREWGFASIAAAQRAVDLKLGERFLPPKIDRRLTVREAWQLYDEGLVARGRPSSAGRFKHLDRHFGGTPLVDLHHGMIDAYRKKRRKEPLMAMKVDAVTRTLRALPRLRAGRTSFPSDCTLDHELKLLRAVVNHALRCRQIASNPLIGIRLLNADDARSSVVTETDFGRLLSKADDWLRPILIVAYDTGMRKREILDLTWDRVDLDGRRILLRADDTKANQARIIFLTERAASVLKDLEPGATGTVFGRELHPKERAPKGSGFRNGFARATQAAGLPQIWFHDLRRSFVTNARKRGVPESVVMKMSGHRTRNVFARYNIIDDADLREAVKKIELGRAET